MTTTKNETPPRLPTAEEFGMLITLTRSIRKWSQETLAELSRLSVRTIQRIEKGLPASIETKRALALAFGLEDIDQFNKTVKIPTAKEVAAQKKKFDEEYITLKATVITTGRQLAELAEKMSAHHFGCDVEIKGQAEEDLATLMDYVTEYGDCDELYREMDKLAVYSDFQGYIDKLKENNISLCYTLRKANFKSMFSEESKPTPVTILYLVAFAKGEEPESFSVEKKFQIK